MKINENNGERSPFMQKAIVTESKYHRILVFRCLFDFIIIIIKLSYLQGKYTEFWATNRKRERIPMEFYYYYSSLASTDLEKIYDYYKGDCIVFDWGCKQTIADILKFKRDNPDFQLKYTIPKWP